MAWHRVDPAYTVLSAENKILQQMTFLVDGSSDLAGLPECAPGSFAYTADMTFIAQYDGSEWVIIKGGD